MPGCQAWQPLFNINVEHCYKYSEWRHIPVTGRFLATLFKLKYILKWPLKSAISLFGVKMHFEIANLIHKVTILSSI